MGPQAAPNPDLASLGQFLPWARPVAVAVAVAIRRRGCGPCAELCAVGHGAAGLPVIASMGRGRAPLPKKAARNLSPS